MMLHYLSGELARNPALRDHFDFTWHLVVCAEPDKARLNEGWFKGQLSLTRYARHYYRPPSYQQVEWTFPVSYKSYRFETPTPEARALMQIIDNNPINFSFGLHNSGFGGVYFYWSRDVKELYPRLYDIVAAATDRAGAPGASPRRSGAHHLEEGIPGRDGGGGHGPAVSVVPAGDQRAAPAAPHGSLRWGAGGREPVEVSDHAGAPGASTFSLAPPAGGA